MAAVSDFAHKFGLVLKACNLSRVRVAQAVGVDKSVVSRWASGGQVPTDHNLTLLTEVVGRHRLGFARIDWDLAAPAFAVRLGLGDAAAGGEPELALPAHPSIAVLPFTNLSDDPEQDYFADGVVEEITTALCRLRWLFVIARNSSFTYKDKHTDVKLVGRELGVRYVLKGSVRRIASRVRIAAQLIDAGSGVHIWADRFDGTLDDIFALHDAVAWQVAGAVEPNLREAEIDRSLRKPTTSLDAYDLYMRGLVAFRSLSPDSLLVTMELTRQAIVLDPNFARALALRGLCIQHLQSGKEDDPVARAEALRLAHAALAACRDDWEAASIAATVISSMGGSIETALAASQRALTLNPSGFLALQHNGWIQCIAGNPAAAIEPFTRALRLSPRDPFLGYCEAGLGVAYRDAGRPQEALVWAQRAIMSLPRLPAGYRAATVALVDLGRIDDAKEQIAQLLKVFPEHRIRPEFVRRHNRNEATAEAWIAALRAAGLPD
ncbi:helix-turn-helix domain-containing protein [Reyranella sp.]|uniref:helix-turn-helix domain-containing protein n=1 Tax=Reyranella sp. TaxID=1929291 RepID=UPI003D0E0E0E